ncbi:putative secreted protein [Bimuria novae-zelandiae CBS 107.79]|uniref:Putative secreted protein n=1 Tax=Bimuria novae-zelandiae CBS 107.79 TaxID=1447943 RepID=A0A6A5UX08_9PLEO|nr:putative secreted protein [Bimuria novae-zelandiae CBS 107.79]
MAKPQVLIIGCGAVGLLQGYYLSSGADITYLVRPGRKSVFTGPKHLYSYKDNELYTFSNYRLVESVSEISGESFAFVFDTLDGHTARSEGGVATIAAVGDLINETQNADCFVMYAAIGLDIEEHYTRTMRIAPTRLFPGVSILVHEPTPRISIPETANTELVAKADLLFAYLEPTVGLLAFDTQPQLVTKLEAIYKANGKLGIQRIPAFVAPWFLPLNMLHLGTWYLDGFQPFEHLRANKELWNLLVRGQTEILSLPRFGWTGWLLSFVVKSWAAVKMNTLVIEGAKPMKLNEFNAYHHGGKVVKQDIRALEDILREGERVGTKMPALTEVVRKLEEKERQNVGRA